MDIELLVNGLSKEKLNTFEDKLGCKTNEDKIATYMFMQDLSSHYFTIIQIIEVHLRNAIHKAATNKFDDDEWFTNVPTSQKSKNQVDKAIEDSLENVGVKYTSDDVIANLSFGFWVHMLHEDYGNPRKKEKNLWQYKFDDAFPYAKNKGKKRAALFRELGTLNKFRNRLYHHEPVWKQVKVNNINDAIKVLDNHYDKHIQFLSYMSKDAVTLIETLGLANKFKQSCKKENLEAYKAKLAALNE
ncbi:Tiorf34 protein [Moritella sp. JT01]|uniref:Abi family protein n=1 Tax=Moritella sp. JT01 TaxID=756698 RepID=UPI0007996F74|nr:Abi family protein [Moritella sp. JT01]KXO06514.1 Tiorf34 protein [Moritella sp. JT01]